jgi:carbonic anhydrase
MLGNLHCNIRRTSAVTLMTALGGVAAYALAADKPHGDWSYEGKTGPKDWGKIKSDYSLCATGADQSPVDLKSPHPGEGDKLRFEYFASPLKIANNGHTFQVNLEKGSFFENGRGRFELLQFHLRTPSEHTLAGKSFPLELHLVHKNTQTDPAAQLAVVGVFLKEGKRLPALDLILREGPAKEGNVEVAGISINPQVFLPRSGGYFYYPGSLTTPPCSEGVAWHVLKEPLEASKEQIAAFRKVFKKNARPVQPLKERVLREM